MSSFTTFLDALLHNLKMAFSKEYEKRVVVDRNLKLLEEAVVGCNHNRAPLERIRHLVGVIYAKDASRVPEAATILASANNFDCMVLAIRCNPQFGVPCADRLMEVAREHLKFCGHMDRAQWARKRLFLAREWYEKADALTDKLAAEIAAGLKATEWVLACND